MTSKPTSDPIELIREVGDQTFARRDHADGPPSP